MLCCNLNKFIFIKTEKTAGTSTQSLFTHYMSNDDPERIVKKGYEEHQFASQILELIGESKFNTYLKFANVRNPFDLVASHYFYGKILKQPYENFDFYIHESGALEAFCERAKKYIFIDQKMILDDFVRFENIHSDCKKICQKLDLPLNKFILNHENPSENRKGLDYRFLYSSDSYRKVGKLFDWYLETFSYSKKIFPMVL